VAHLQSKTLLRLAVVVVLVHAVAFGFHGVAHTGLHIELSRWANIFVACTIGIGPIVGLCLSLSRPARVGAAILTVTMAGSFWFGLWKHYLVASTDHVAHLPDAFWKLPFQITACLLLVSEAAGAAVGLALLRLGGRVHTKP